MSAEQGVREGDRVRITLSMVTPCCTMPLTLRVDALVKAGGMVDGADEAEAALDLHVANCVR